MAGRDIREHGIYRVGKCCDRINRHDPPVALIRQHLGNFTHFAGDCRHPATHRFENGQWSRFRARGHDQYI